MRISDWSSDVCSSDLKDPQLGTDRQGTNPLSYFTIKQNGRDIPLSNLYGTYDWVRDNGYANMPAWIETAAKAAGRSEERRVGNGCVSKCRSGWSRYHKKNNKTIKT